MKNLKKIAVVAMLGVMSFGAYSTYEYVVMTDAEHLMMENVEALTSRENGGDWYTLHLPCQGGVRLLHIQDQLVVGRQHLIVMDVLHVVRFNMTA